MHGLKTEGANISHSVTNLSNLEWTEWYYARGALAPFTVITNLTVVISSGVILKSNVQPRTFYMFMGNLALADLLHGGMTVAELILRTYTQETIFYILQLGLNLSSILASSLGVCVIAVDRYIYLKYSIHYTIWMNQITAKRIIIGIWIYSYMIGFVCEFIFSRPVSKNYVDNRFITITPMYMLAVIACSLVIPICITIVLYTSVLITVYKLRRKEPRETAIKYSKYEERRKYFRTLKLNSFHKSNDTTISTISENITACKTTTNIEQNRVSFTFEDVSARQNRNSTDKSQCCEIDRENINVKNSILVTEQQNITYINSQTHKIVPEQENINVKNSILVTEQQNITDINSQTHKIVPEQENKNDKNSILVTEQQNITYINSQTHKIVPEQENINDKNSILVTEQQNITYINSQTHKIVPEQENINDKNSILVTEQENIYFNNSTLVPEQPNITDINCQVDKIVPVQENVNVNNSKLIPEPIINNQALVSENVKINIKVEEPVGVKVLTLVQEQGDVNLENSSVSVQNNKNLGHTLKEENTNIQNPALVTGQYSKKNVEILALSVEQDNTNFNITEVESDLHKVRSLSLNLEDKKSQKLCCGLEAGSIHTKYVGNNNKITLVNPNKQTECAGTNSCVGGFDRSNKQNDSDSEIKVCYKAAQIYRSKINSSHRKRINFRSFVMVFLVMFVFTMSWGPYCVSLIIYVLLCHGAKATESHKCSNLQVALNTFLLSLGFVNALINPFLYCWWHKGFRASLRRICCKNNVREKKRNDFISSLRY